MATNARSWSNVKFITIRYHSDSNDSIVSRLAAPYRAHLRRRPLPGTTHVSKGGAPMIANGMRRMRRTGATAVAAVLAFAWSGASEARITRIVMDEPNQPLPGVCAYEKLSGRAFGEVDPADRRNAIIQDIDLAPRNENGQEEDV